MKNFFYTFALLFIASCNAQTKKTVEQKTTSTKENNKTMTTEIKKTEAEWKELLTPEQFSILREKGTERPHSGEYNEFYEEGSYNCAACDNPLFTSDTKFDGHCGWPSFDKAIKGSTKENRDTSYGMIRVEVVCAKCDGHLGHVFDDGPVKTTGLRYCTNSVSIKFVPKK
jgi:peptide-methionine (R)-S-oxide reductase